jgi:type IV pilus assembly protein PilF
MNASKTSERHMSLATRMLLGIVVVMVLGACVSTVNNETETRSDRVKKLQNAAQLNTQLGIAYMHEGNLALAKEKLDKAMKEGPEEPAVHSAMALLYDRMNKPQQADGEFREALRLAPHDPDILNNYAIYLCRTGRTDEGVKQFLDAAQNALYATPAVAFTNAGVCLRTAKRYDQATEQFRKALAARPNFAEAAFQLIDTDFALGKLKDARSLLDSYLGAFDPTPDLLLIGVRVARAQGDRMAAERFWRRLRESFPTSDQARAASELERNPG